MFDITVYLHCCRWSYNKRWCIKEVNDNQEVNCLS